MAGMVSGAPESRCPARVLAMISLRMGNESTESLVAAGFHMTRSEATRVSYEETRPDDQQAGGTRPWVIGRRPAGGRASPGSSATGGLSRRGFLRASGVSALARRRRRPAGRLRHRGHQADRRHLHEQGPSDTEKVLVFSNWPHYIDVDEPGKKDADARGLREADRHQGHLQHRRQRQQRVLRQGAQPARCLRADRARHLRAHRLDGRPDDRARLDPGARHGERCPTSRPTCRTASEPALGPGPGALRAVAERPHRHRLQREVHRRGRAASRSWSPAPTSRARSACSARCATRWASCSSWSAPTRTTSPTTTGARRSTSCEEIVASGQVRQFTGNDYVQALNNGDIVACEAWSGDVIAMQYDNPDIKFVDADRGPVAVERQHAGARTRPTTRPTPRS